MGQTGTLPQCGNVGWLGGEHQCTDGWVAMHRLVVFRVSIGYLGSTLLLGNNVVHIARKTIRMSFGFESLTRSDYALDDGSPRRAQRSRQYMTPGGVMTCARSALRSTQSAPRNYTEPLLDTVH